MSAADGSSDRDSFQILALYPIFQHFVPASGTIEYESSFFPNVAHKPHTAPSRPPVVAAECQSRLLRRSVHLRRVHLLSLAENALQLSLARSNCAEAGVNIFGTSFRKRHARSIGLGTQFCLAVKLATRPCPSLFSLCSSVNVIHMIRQVGGYQRNRYEATGRGLMAPTWPGTTTCRGYQNLGICHSKPLSMTEGRPPETFSYSRIE